MRSAFLLFSALLIGETPLLTADILYSVTDLGSLSSSGYSYGYGMNNVGQVTGVSNNAFLYTNGRMQDLGTLGGLISMGYAINNAGQVTGIAAVNSSYGHAFLYTNGQMQDLGTLPGGTNSTGLAINNVGQVAGWSSVAGDTFQHAFLYTNGQMQDLGNLGGIGGEALGINDAGQVVGAAGFTVVNGHSPVHAFLYSNGQMQDLNALIDPALHLGLTEANAINDRGQIVTNTGVHAYLLTPVPEPGTWALLGVSILVLLGGRHYARKRFGAHPSIFNI